MPLVNYCNKCGKPTEYSLVAPKFCAHCGNSFANFSKPPAPPIPVINNNNFNKVTETPSPQRQINKNMDNIEDFGYILDNIDNIPPLECEVIVSKRPKTTLRDAALDVPSDPSMKLNRPPAYKNKRVSKKQILEDFQREAGNLGKGNSINLAGEQE